MRINGTTKSEHHSCLKRKAASLLTPPCLSAAGAELDMQLVLLLPCPMAVLLSSLGTRDNPGWDGDKMQLKQVEANLLCKRGFVSHTSGSVLVGPGESLWGDGQMMGKVSGWVLDRQVSGCARAFP